MTLNEAIDDLPSFPETGIEQCGTEYNAWCENSEYSCPYRLDEIRRVLESQRDEYSRLAADFDNYRKRVIKEKEAIAFVFKSMFQALTPEELKSARENILKKMKTENTTKSAYSALIDDLIESCNN